MKSYKTTQLRRDRFKKPPSCRSAPLIHPNENRKEGEENDLEPGLTLSHSATELPQHMDSEQRVSPLTLNGSGLNEHDTDPILSYITKARCSLGLDTKPEKSSTMPGSVDVGTSRDTAIADSGPITGVKDLKLLSRRLSSLSDTMSTHGSVEFVYALRSDTSTKFNPYNLSIVSAERARMHQSYYTISAYSVTKVLYYS